MVAPMTETPLFEQLVTPTLDECKALLRTRGEQYGDTWAKCQWVQQRAVLFTTRGIKISMDESMAVGLASFSDMKYWRCLGGFAPDHFKDGINYEAALVTIMDRIYTAAGNNGQGKPGFNGDGKDL